MGTGPDQSPPFHAKGGPAMTFSVRPCGEPAVVTGWINTFLSASDRPFPGFALRFDSNSLGSRVYQTRSASID
jgi:hypothetical protein